MIERIKIYKPGRILVALILILAGCAEEPTKSIYDKSYVSGQPVVISEVIQPNPVAILSGVDALLIRGQNFPPEIAEIGVMFNEVRAEVIALSTGELQAKVPASVYGDSVILKIWVSGADKFSNTIYLNIEYPASEFYDFKDTETPYVVAMDQQENLFLSMVDNAAGKGIKRIPAGGSLEDYANKGGETFYTGLKVAPNNNLIAGRSLKALFVLPEKTGADPVNPAVWWNDSGTPKYADFDFAPDSSLWVAGNNTTIVHLKVNWVSGTKTPVRYNFTGDLRSVRYFENHVYVAGLVNAEESVWRAEYFPNDSLGAFEKYFSLQNYTGSTLPRIFAITFSADGYLYIGTSADNSIIEVSPDGASAEDLYPGLLPGEARYFTWDSDYYLIYNQGFAGDLAKTVTITKVNTRKFSAPYFGRGDQ